MIINNILDPNSGDNKTDMFPYPVDVKSFSNFYGLQAMAVRKKEINKRPDYDILISAIIKSKHDLRNVEMHFPGWVFMKDLKERETIKKLDKYGKKFANTAFKYPFELYKMSTLGGRLTVNNNKEFENLRKKEACMVEDFARIDFEIGEEYVHKEKAFNIDQYMFHDHPSAVNKLEAVMGGLSQERKTKVREARKEIAKNPNVNESKIIRLTIELAKLNKEVREKMHNKFKNKLSGRY